MPNHSMQDWLIDGIMSAVAYGATEHFLTRKIKGFQRILICFVVAVGICCTTRFVIDSISN